MSTCIAVWGPAKNFNDVLGIAPFFVFTLNETHFLVFAVGDGCPKTIWPEMEVLLSFQDTMRFASRVSGEFCFSFEIRKEGSCYLAFGL